MLVRERIDYPQDIGALGLAACLSGLIQNSAAPAQRHVQECYSNLPAIEIFVIYSGKVMAN